MEDFATLIRLHKIRESKIHPYLESSKMVRVMIYPEHQLILDDDGLDPYIQKIGCPGEERPGFNYFEMHRTVSNGSGFYAYCTTN
ncbi:MAG: hypothetical protein JG781_1148 [Peptococcaceae bacterium]|jgi:hypothetical protein|nr:hypothetical protein [Peptococcaceae bacterium]